MITRIDPYDIIAAVHWDDPHEVAAEIAETLPIRTADGTIHPDMADTAAWLRDVAEALEATR